MAVRPPKPAAPAAPGVRAAAHQKQSAGPAATAGGATTVGATTATSKGYKDFADTVTSEIQAIGDQSQGMHDDPRNAYRTRKTYLLVIEIIMAVCVIALIVGTVVMFVVSTNTGTITLKGESEAPHTAPPSNQRNDTKDVPAADHLEGEDDDSFTTNTIT